MKQINNRQKKVVPAKSYIQKYLLSAQKTGKGVAQTQQRLRKKLVHAVTRSQPSARSESSDQI